MAALSLDVKYGVILGCNDASECAAKMGVLSAVNNTAGQKSAPILFGTFPHLLVVSEKIRCALNRQVRKSNPAEVR